MQSSSSRRGNLNWHAGRQRQAPLATSLPSGTCTPFGNDGLKVHDTSHDLLRYVERTFCCVDANDRLLRPAYSPLCACEFIVRTNFVPETEVVGVTMNDGSPRKRRRTMMRLYPDEEEVNCHLLHSTHTCWVGLPEQEADHLLCCSVMHWNKRATRMTSQVQNSWT